MVTPARFTEDERRLLQLVVRGSSDRQIARELGVSESTVQRRLRRLATTLVARSRVEIAVRAVALGVVPAPPHEDAEG